MVDRESLLALYLRSPGPVAVEVDSSRWVEFTTRVATEHGSADGGVQVAVRSETTVRQIGIAIPAELPPFPALPGVPR